MRLSSSEDFSNIPNLFFKWIGRPTNRTGGAENRSFYKKSIVFYLLLANLIVVVGQESIMLYIGIAQSETADWLICTLLILCIGYCSIAVVKMVALFVNNGLVSRLIYRLEDIYPRTWASQRQYHSDEYFTRSNRIMKIYSVLYVVMLVFFALCFSLAQTYQQYVQTGVRQWQLPYAYMLWYPFDENQGVGFYLALVQQYVAAYFAVCGIVAADTLLFSMVMQISMHFQELQNRFKTLRLGRDASVMVAMKELTAKHVQIIG